MKRYLYISCMLLATLVLTVFAVFPHHHHHEGLVCMVTEICDSTGLPDDEHPEHHHAGDANHGNHNCIFESVIVLPSGKEEVTCKSCTCDHCDHLHHFAIHYLLAEFLIYEELSDPKPDYGEFIVSYKPMDASQTHGLRAPPFLSSEHS